jgi:hypothetical protein
LRPYIVGFHMRPQPSRVDAREVSLVEIDCSLHLAVACLLRIAGLEAMCA